MKEHFLLICIILFFILFSLFLPIYDETNGFHNIIIDNYNLTWYDGRSPINFYMIKNIIKNNSISFSKGYMIGNSPAENFYDLVEKDGKFYPRYAFTSNYIYAIILNFLPSSSDLEMFKMMMIVNVLFFAVILIIFYHIQKILGLKIKYCLLSTFVAGIATSLLIYSRYFFIKDSLFTLVFLLLIYQILKNWKKASIKNDISLILILSVLLLITLKFYASITFFILFCYFFIKYKSIKSIKTYLSIIIILILLLTLDYSYRYGLETKENWVVNETETTLGMSIFPKFIHALDFVIYGYHDPKSVWKFFRMSNFIYTFLERPGNAIFLQFYGLFGSLFGTKGFVYNSIFLIFSIFGILAYKKGGKRNIILTSVIFIILIYGLIHPTWYGGVTPRYVRFFNIPVLFLTFFSFYYIQEVSKEKNKIKRLMIYSIFVIMIILSMLNVISLAVRADWTYEHEANLISYDLVLWPWYLPKTQENVINLYLTELGESVEWNFGGEIEGCKDYGTLEGIITPVCGCEYATYAERYIEVPWEKIRVNVTACSRGGDVIGRFYFDDIEKEIIIQPSSCERVSILIKNSKGKRTIVLKSKKYKECIDETVIWKLITIEKLII